MRGIDRRTLCFFKALRGPGHSRGSSHQCLFASFSALEKEELTFKLSEDLHAEKIKKHKKIADSFIFIN